MNQPIFNLLVPYDFSEQSYSGLIQARYIAEQRPVKITVLHVIKENVPPWNIFTPEQINFYENKIIEVLTYECEDAKIPKNSFSVVVEFGKFNEIIHQTAEKLNIDCILMGTNAGDPRKKKIIGSNALKILNEAKIPVITVKHKCDYSDLSTIILPLDLAKETLEKIPIALKMAKLLGAKIKIVSLVSTDDEHVNKRLQTTGQQALDFIRQREIEGTLEIIKYEGTSRKLKLTDYFEANKGLAIITTNQQPEIIDFFIGSFASDVIQLAPIPVMSAAPRSVFKYSLMLPGMS